MVIQKIPTCLKNVRQTLESTIRNTLLKASLKFSWYNASPKIQWLFNLILYLKIQKQLSVLKITFAHYFDHYSQVLLDIFICSGKKYPFKGEKKDYERDILVSKVGPGRNKCTCCLD